MRYFVVLKKNNGLVGTFNRNLLHGVIDCANIDYARNSADIYRNMGYNAGVVPATARNRAAYLVPVQILSELESMQK